LALNVSFGMKVGLGLGGVGVHLFVGIDHLVVSNMEPINVGGDSPVVEISCGLLDEGISGWVLSEKGQRRC
jgi:hypothetical protein